MNGTDIAGYLWRGETFCPVCVHDLFVDALASDANRSTEEILDRAAAERGINRHDERSADSRQLPQALYLDDVTSADRCFFCGVALTDQPA